MEHIYTETQFGENWFTYPNLYRQIVEQAGDNQHFVEVGSWKGKSSAFLAVEIANSGKNIKFDCVDTWEGGPEHVDFDTSALYDTFISNMKPLEKYYNPIKATSVEAAKLYEDESLDFVFIDACHQYECVVEDIRAWYPKVKKNGIISGHDYNDSWPGVVRAVNENIKGSIYTGELCWMHRKE
jgi:predicted O-methyltransferase YrrM